MAQPFKPTNIVRASELVDIPVDSIFIGSCTNGRLEDMKVVSKILKGRTVKKGIVLRITPATKEVWMQSIREGLIDVLNKAGATVFTNPGCGGCAEGMAGMVGEDEVSLSTTNRNYKGKQGPGKIYLVSPAVAAASAVTGKLTTPDELEVKA